MDRDGTVSEEVGYMYDPGRYKPFAWAGPAIRRINESGMKAVLITNQSGVGRGYFDEAGVHAFCPHGPDAGCECRKPNPGMLLRAQRELAIDLTESYVIGDKHVDVETAYAVSAKSVLVLTGYGRDEREKHKDSEHQPHLVAEDLMEAVEVILAGALR